MLLDAGIPGGDNRLRPRKGAGGEPVRMLTTLEQVWLLAAVAKGDRAAYERLYQATNAKIYGMVLRILRRTALADEVMRETYLKVWNTAGQFDPASASPMTWMVAIARNHAIDLVRGKSEVVLDEEAEAIEPSPESDAAIAPRELSAELKNLLACLGKLDEDSRRMVLLAYYSGWSRDRLAAEFELSVGSVKARLRRALGDIRECLGP